MAGPITFGCHYCAEHAAEVEQMLGIKMRDYRP